MVQIKFHGERGAYYKSRVSVCAFLEEQESQEKLGNLHMSLTSCIPLRHMYYFFIRLASKQGLLHSAFLTFHFSPIHTHTI